jgi:serine phosphatase RsbU (regulator of sigma subunit)
VPTVHDAETVFTLDPGESLVLVTDGLIERRGSSFNEGLERLEAALAADLGADGGDGNLEAVCDRLLLGLGDESDDDQAMLVIRRGISA